MLIKPTFFLSVRISFLDPAGQITYSMQSKSVYFCDGRVWVGLQPTISALGKSEGYPARSCHDLLSRTGALNESGIYWIKPSTEYSAFQVGWYNLVMSGSLCANGVAVLFRHTVI